MRKIKKVGVVGLLFLQSFPVFSQTLKEKAETGDRVAQFQYGESLKVDNPSMAQVWLEKSAKQGYAPAQREIGYYYSLNGDYNKTVYWYKKAVSQGEKIAQYYLGACYEKGQGVQQSGDSAVFWYNKSAAQGYSRAENELGHAYYYGKIVRKNLGLAKEWFSKAASHDNSDAMFHLGEFYAHGYGGSIDMEKAVEWYEDSYDDDNTRAAFALANLYFDGIGVDKDSLEAAEYLLSSAIGGGCRPNNIISIIDHNYSSANMKARNKLLQLSLLEQSPKQHHFLAMTGCMFFSMKDFDKAEIYFKHAIKKGSYLATIELGLMYFYILSGAPQQYSGFNFANAGVKGIFKELYELTHGQYPFTKKSNDLRYEFADKICIDYLKNKKWTNEDNMVYWLERSINDGKGSFLTWLSSSKSSSENVARVYSLYDYLLFAYVYGLGTKKNYNRAIDIAKMSVSEDKLCPKDIASKTLDIVSEERTFHDKIFKTYKNLFQIPVNKNDNLALCHDISVAGLGKCYYFGKGTAINYNLAFRYLSEAVKSDFNCESRSLLAACYQYGRGTAMDLIKAKEWIDKAAECNGGNPVVDNDYMKGRINYNKKYDKNKR